MKNKSATSIVILILIFVAAIAQAQRATADVVETEKGSLIILPIILGDCAIGILDLSLLLTKPFMMIDIRQGTQHVRHQHHQHERMKSTYG